MDDWNYDGLALHITLLMMNEYITREFINAVLLDAGLSPEGFSYDRFYDSLEKLQQAMVDTITEDSE